MYSVSDEYTRLMDDDSAELDVYVEVDFGDGAIVLSGEQIEYIDFDERVNDNSNILTLGCACSHSVTIRLREPPALQYKGLKCKPRTGIMLSDGTIEWVPLGVFWVDTAKTNDDYKTVTITAYDKMYRLNSGYKTSLAYPALFADVVNEFETLAGVKVVEPEEFPNFYIENKVEDDAYKLRDIAGHLAGCLGRNATFNRDGDMEFARYTLTPVKAVEDLQYMNGFEKLADNALKVDFIVTGQEGEIKLENDGTDPGAIDWSAFDVPSAEDFPLLKFTYVEKTGTAAVSMAEGCQGYAGPINIPTRVICGGTVCTVASVLDYGFSNCAASAIKLPETIVSIGEYAFFKCTNLQSIVIPDAVTSIGYAAFKWAGITSITISDSVTFLGWNAFNGCEKLTSINFGTGLTVLSPGLCGGCTALTSVVLPDNIQTIDSNAFNGCTNLTRVQIGASAECAIKSINGTAFVGTGVTELVIWKSPSSISGSPWGASNATISWMLE